MHRKLEIWLFSAVMMFAAGSCVRDPGIFEAGEDGEKTVQLTMSVPGAAHPAYTRLTDDKEQEVNKVTVLVFDAGGKYVCMRRATRVGSTGNSYDVRLPVGRRDLMVLGNIIPPPDLNPVPGVSTWDEIAEAATVKVAKPEDWRYLIPIFGYRKNVDIAHNTGSLGTIYMHRMHARIDLKLSTEAASGTAGGTGNANFALSEVYLCNHNVSGRIVPDIGGPRWNETGGTHGKGEAVLPTLPQNPMKQIGIGTPDSPAPAFKITAADNAFFSPSGVTNTIYVSEAEGGDLSTAKENPCIVFGGSYRGGPTTYYRADFVRKDGANDIYLDLLRNHIYTITVNRISGAGYPAPGDAYASASQNISLDVVQWNEADLDGVDVDGRRYNVNVTTDGFGAAQSNYRVAVEGMRVQVMASPAVGYAFKRWVVTGGAAPAGLNTGANPAAFTMPAGDVSLRAEFFVPTLSAEAENGRITLDATGRYALTTDPTDAGLYFRFGSVVGLYSAHGRNQKLPFTVDQGDTFEAAADVAWSPVDIQGWAWITHFGNASWEAGYRGVTPEDGWHNADAVKRGYGDPCRLVGLDLDRIKNTPLDQLRPEDVDNHTWRLPTVAENKSFMKSETTHNYTAHVITYGGVPGGMFPTAAAGDASTFLPLAGCRLNTDGTVYQIGIRAEYYTSQAEFYPDWNAPIGKALFFSDNLIAPDGGNNMAMTIRCVRQTERPLYTNGNPAAVRPGPLDGPKAPPGILGVGAMSGMLTLRGSMEYASDPALKAYADAEFGGLAQETVLMAHFRWGSLVAMRTTAGDTWHGVQDVIWAPRGYDLQAISTDWPNEGQGVPYVAFPAAWPETDNPPAGIGDACRLADRGTSGKTWVTPTGHPWNGIDYTDFPTVTVEAVFGHRDPNNPAFFFPSAGSRTGGNISSDGHNGYWTASTLVSQDYRNVARSLTWNDSNGGLWPHGGDARVHGFALRCVPAESEPRKTVTVGNLIWAEYNLATAGRFETSLYEVGAYFTWNNRTPWAYEPGAPSGELPIASVWTRAKDPCPAPWRMPTKADYDALLAATSGSSWAYYSAFPNEKVRLFDIAATKEMLIFPGGGWGKSDGDTRNSQAAYWSATPDDNDSWCAWHLYFNNVSANTAVNGWGYKGHSYPVRCVKDR